MLARRWWVPFAGGAGYGALTIAAFPPLGAWPLALLATLPLLWCAAAAAAGGMRPWRAAALAAAGSAPMWAFEHRWLLDVTSAGFPGLVLYLSTTTGVTVWGIMAVKRAWPAAPMAAVGAVVWTGMEFLRGEVVLTGYPWFLVGHPLIENAWLAAPAAIVGANGVSFLAVGLSGAVLDLAGLAGAASRRTGWSGLAVVAATWVVLAWAGRTVGAIPPRAREEPTVRVAVIQTNVPQSNKIAWSLEQRIRDFARFWDLTRQAAAASPPPDVIVWPETMFPGEGLNPEAVEAQRRLRLAFPQIDPADRQVPMTVFADAMGEYQADLGVPMLVGAIAVEGLAAEPAPGAAEGTLRLSHSARFNSAMVMAGGKVVGARYDKVALTPFGEVIPLLWRWPRLQNLVVALGASGMTFSLAPGREARIVEVPLGPAADAADGPGLHGTRVLRCATPICFEATKSSVCRRLAYAGGRPRADVLVNLSNDGWFGRWRGGREQHLLAARWRCVELGLPMVRAVNTGISACIDPAGSVVRAGPEGRNQMVDVDGIMAVDVPLAPARPGTVFGKMGNIPGWLAVGAMGAWVALALRVAGGRVGAGGVARKHGNGD